MGDYLGRLGNRTVYKRLGYLVEALGLDAPDLLRECEFGMSSGISLLGPQPACQGNFPASLESQGECDRSSGGGLDR